MHNLLMPDAAAERLKHELEPLLDKVKLFFMHDGGKITHDGVEIEPGAADIHLGLVATSCLVAMAGSMRCSY